MPLLSPHSDLFWATFWPCASFGLTALVFAILLVWLWSAPAAGTRQAGAPSSRYVLNGKAWP